LITFTARAPVRLKPWVTACVGPVLFAAHV